MAVIIDKHVIGYTEDGKKIVEVSRYVHTRKIDRMVINKKFKSQGHTKYRKHSHSNINTHRASVTPSYFAENWRKYSTYDYVWKKE